MQTNNFVQKALKLVGMKINFFCIRDQQFYTHATPRRTFDLFWTTPRQYSYLIHRGSLRASGACHTYIYETHKKHEALNLLSAITCAGPNHCSRAKKAFH